MDRELFSGMRFAPLFQRTVLAALYSGAVVAAMLLLPSKGAYAQEDPSQRLHDEQPNAYRRAEKVSSFLDVRDNMRDLFEKLLSDAGSEIDKHYSPHLRDILVEGWDRFLHAWIRANAGTEYSFWGCFGACPGCGWIDWDYTGQCCNGPTEAYGGLMLDHNFKTCCVRNGEENWTEEQIACAHPMGDGWAGLFEFYFPATVIGWENDRTTTMIVEKEKVNQCVEAADPLMEGSEAVEWVADAIAKNLDEVGGPVAVPGRESNPRGEIENNVRDVIKAVRPQDKKLRFTDSLQGEGLTMRVNFATMDPIERRLLAWEFCMHPDQFMKIMDPQEDPYQKVPLGSGTSFGMLQAIPVFANYCENGVRLMTSVWESAFLKPVDGTPTDLSKGFLAGYLGVGPMYCQAMHARDNSYLTQEQRQVILQSGTAPLDEQMVGYSCRNNGQSWVGLSPVALHRTAQVERRAPEHALAFAIAGGLFEKDTQATKKSYYKRFEPMPYSQQAKIFSGKPFEAAPMGMANEMGLPCKRTLNGESYQGKNMPDQWYISDKTHNFVQDTIQDWNKFYSEWTTDGNTPKRGLDDKSQNYAAMSRIFASCPLGYKPWKGKHSNDAQRACGSEKLW
jgi:hypothetical protein